MVKIPVVTLKMLYFPIFGIAFGDFDDKMAAHPGFSKNFKKNHIIVLFGSKYNFLGGRANDSR